MEDSRQLQSRGAGRGGLALLPFAFRPHKYPKTSASLLLWLAGLYFVFLAKAPYTPTAEDVAVFEAKLKEVEALDAEIATAYEQYARLDGELQALKVWFWRWRELHRERVREKQPAVDTAWAAVDGLQRRQDRLYGEAKARLGLWSDAGVGESKALFWKSFQSGKVFAQRRTFWDALFQILNSRDRDWLSMLLQLIFTTVINFTTGLTVSVFFFLASLPSLLASYQPGWWSGLLFFAVSALGAVSVVVSFLGLLYVAGATAVYSTISLVDASRRLEGAQQAQRQRIAGGSEEHHED